MPFSEKARELTLPKEREYDAGAVTRGDSEVEAGILGVPG
jgi:hypothetical protein